MYRSSFDLSSHQGVAKFGTLDKHANHQYFLDILYI